MVLLVSIRKMIEMMGSSILIFFFEIKVFLDIISDWYIKMFSNIKFNMIDKWFNINWCCCFLKLKMEISVNIIGVKISFNIKGLDVLIIIFLVVFFIIGN